MQRKINLANYSKTVIYKVICIDDNIKDVYVGHTINFTRRRNEHKNSCNNEKRKSFNYKLYKIIRENGGWNNWSMIEVEKYPTCENRLQAGTKEKYWYEKLNANINCHKPTRTKKEYCQDNKEEIKKYRDDHKEEKKKYREDNKEKIKKYRDDNKEKHKEYMKNYHMKKKQQLVK